MSRASPRISQDFLTDLQRRETQDKCVLVKSGVIANDQVHKGPLAGPFSAHIICLSYVAQCVIQYSAFLVGLKICFIKQQLHSKINIKSGVLTQEQGGLNLIFFISMVTQCHIGHRTYQKCELPNMHNCIQHIQLLYVGVRDVLKLCSKCP